MWLWARVVCFWASFFLITKTREVELMWEFQSKNFFFCQATQLLGCSPTRDWTLCGRWKSCVLINHWITREFLSSYTLFLNYGTHDITYLWNLKYDMSLSIKHKQTHRCREQTVAVGGGGWWRGKYWEFGTSRCKLIYRMGKQQGPTL